MNTKSLSIHRVPATPAFALLQLPVLPGDGVRLFDRLGPVPIEWEQTAVVEAPGVTALRFQVVR